jgi:uncharacterized protein (TIGR02246 family)
MILKSTDPYGFHFINDWAAAVSSGNIESVIGLYESEAVLVPTFSANPVRGSEVIRAYFEALYEERPNLTVDILEGEVNQNLGDSRALSGRYRFTWGTNLEDMATVDARYTFVIETVDGAWAAKTHHSSQNPS